MWGTITGIMIMELEGVPVSFWRWHANGAVAYALPCFTLLRLPPAAWEGLVRRRIQRVEPKHI